MIFLPYPPVSHYLLPIILAIIAFITFVTIIVGLIGIVVSEVVSSGPIPRPTTIRQFGLGFVVTIEVLVFHMFLCFVVNCYAKHYITFFRFVNSFLINPLSKFFVKPLTILILQPVKFSFSQIPVIFTLVFPGV